MLDEIKDKLNEVIAIADSCPEKYQIKCFEVLLKALMNVGTPGATSSVMMSTQGTSVEGRTFLTQYGVSQEELDKVVHYNGETYGIIVKDLRENTKAKSQVKLGLLLGIKTLLATGKGMVEKAELVELCQHYSVYDSGNFSTHMRNNKNLFMAVGTIGSEWTLTRPGQQQAAEVIKELAQ